MEMPVYVMRELAATLDKTGGCDSHITLYASVACTATVPA